MTGESLDEHTLLTQYARRYPEAFTSALLTQDKEQALDLLRRLPEQTLPKVIAHLSRSLANAFLTDEPDALLVKWLTDPPLIEAVRVARRVSATRLANLSQLLPAKRRDALNQHLQFPEDSLGASTDADYDSIQASASVSEAVQTLGNQTVGSDAPLLVLDADDRLLGCLDARKALLLGAKARVRECTMPVQSFPASAKLQTVLARPEIYQQEWLTVVDDHRRPIGLVSISRLAGVSTEKAQGRQGDFAVLASMMFDVWAELPLVSDASRRTP